MLLGKYYVNTVFAVADPESHGRFGVWKKNGSRLVQTFSSFAVADHVGSEKKRQSRDRAINAHEKRERRQRADKQRCAILFKRRSILRSPFFTVAFFFAWSCNLKGPFHERKW